MKKYRHNQFDERAIVSTEFFSCSQSCRVGLYDISGYGFLSFWF